MSAADTTIVYNVISYQRTGSVGEITFNRPEKGNALSPDAVEKISSALDRATDDGVRLIVLRGAGKHFCTGFDLSDVERCSDGDLLLRFVRIELLLQKIYRSPVMIVGLGHGRVYGAGADIFAACERRIAIVGSSYAFPGTGFGLILGTRRLGVRVGNDIARRVLIEGQTLTHADASAIGLATDVCETANIERLLNEIATKTERLSIETAASIRTMTEDRADSDDLAALVRSASVPMLKQRIDDYRLHAAAARVPAS